MKRRKIGLTPFQRLAVGTTFRVPRRGPLRRVCPGEELLPWLAPRRSQRPPRQDPLGGGGGGFHPAKGFWVLESVQFREVKSPTASPRWLSAVCFLWMFGGESFCASSNNLKRDVSNPCCFEIKTMEREGRARSFQRTRSFLSRGGEPLAQW